MDGKRKKKKKVNAAKQFKEPSPNPDRMRALENAYMSGVSSTKVGKAP